ncbi:hypothetical protein ACQP2F_31210 [Actinoplanes sp. CA-030573]|uniref:hypothetical protein n=1 Tax=Actinoplanes sp. CA-030573 TaxID=3239898 RepID=UPI003D89CD34
MRWMPVNYGFGGDVSVSLPVLAARAQLGHARAQTSLQIRGYTGTLKLPTFETLNVDNYGDYIKTVSYFQDRLTASTDGVTPVLLFRLAPEPLNRFPDGDDAGLQDEIRQVYVSLKIDNDDRRPDEVQRAEAHQSLHGVALRGGWFNR